MRFIVAIILSVLLCAFSCEDSDNVTMEEGTYKGQFYRADPVADYPAANVTITFSNGRFEGTSSTPKAPGICKGTYTVNGDVATFKDECYWTADFDWTFILSGDFRVRATRDSLIMTASWGGDIKDVYRLRRERQ